VVYGGLLLCATTHAPDGPEVEQILSNLMALFAARRASCDRGFRKGQQGSTSQQKMRSKASQSAGVDGLMRQKSIRDNQSHHARENQQGREGFSDHWPGRIARSRWSGLRFIALDLANGQHRGLGFARHLESGSIVSQELLRV
jgi:hypothetical protein